MKNIKLWIIALVLTLCVAFTGCVNTINGGGDKPSSSEVFAGRIAAVVQQIAANTAPILVDQYIQKGVDDGKYTQEEAEVYKAFAKAAINELTKTSPETLNDLKGVDISEAFLAGCKAAYDQGGKELLEAYIKEKLEKKLSTDKAQAVADAVGVGVDATTAKEEGKK